MKACEAAASRERRARFWASYAAEDWGVLVVILERSGGAVCRELGEMW